MTAAIREGIIAALDSALSTITVTNGYRTNIATVEQKGRDWAELVKSEANPTDGGWLGIVPQEENYVDLPGIIQSTWIIDIIAHIRTSASTEAAALAAASDLATDLRRLFYDTLCGTLGVNGVHFVTLNQRRDSLGSPEALDERWTTCAFRISVRFEEALGVS